MKNGIYKLTFNTNVNINGNIDGVVVINNGAFNGGGNVSYYQGIINGNKALVKSIPYNENDPTSFNGTVPLDLELTIQDHGNHHIFKGHIKDDPSNTIFGKLDFLNHLISKY